MHPIVSNIWKLKTMRVLLSLIFSMPIMVLFWQEHGLTMTQIMLLQSIFSIAIVILEVPTGYFADRMTRRTSLICTGWFIALGYIIYGLSTWFMGFMIAEITLALGLSFLSGADSALLYETLLTLWREKEHTKIYGEYEFLMYLWFAGSQILGSVAATFMEYNIIILLSVPFLFIAFLLSFSLIEPPRKYEDHTHHASSLESIKLLAREHFHPSGPILTIVVFWGLIYGLTQSIVWLYTPYFVSAQIPIEFFGVIFASFQIVAAYSSKHAHAIEKWLWWKHMFLVSSCILMVSYICMALFPYAFGFVFWYLQQFIRGFQKPILATKINELAPSKYRATLLSVQWLSGRLLYALFIPSLGLVVDAFWWSAGLWTLALGSFCIGLYFFFSKRDL